MRLFIALDISSPDKTTIAQWRDTTISAPLKKTDKHNFHITLSFLGTTTQAQLEEIVLYIDTLMTYGKALPTVSLELQSLGLFKQPKVLYLGLHETPLWLDNLAVHLKEKALALGIHQEQRPYVPHLTLCRKASSFPQVMDANLTVAISSFSVYISESTDNGVRYSVLKSWPLFAPCNIKDRKL